jgi:two-component system sensor histidine kinase RpfC
MNMPEVSGVEVVQSLRFMDTSGALPVIMLTADATTEARELSLSAGANRFLTKPIDARGLLECIASLSKNIRKAKTVKIPALRESRTRLRSNYNESEWFDNIVLHELDVLGNDPDFIKTLLKNFEKDGTGHVLEIKQSMYDDYVNYRDSLHALKGSATELGANRLVEICVEGEALKPYDMGSEKVEQMSKRIAEVFDRTIAALNNAAMAEEVNVYSKKLPER